VVNEPWWVFALRLAMLLGFAVALGVMAPKFCFVLWHHTGVDLSAAYPPGMADYRMSLVRGVTYYRTRDALGVPQGWVGVRCSTEAGGARGWSGTSVTERIASGGE
jgi:hypothetical protein